jgi:phosphate:Na+ symporter
MKILDFIVFFGGLALFLYGMRTMGDGLEKTAGEKMQKIIESVTGNLLKSVLAGVIVTTLVQSSSASTVMVIGFVNAGIMNLTQAVGIIMGANIGTTITAQIIRLGDLDKSAWYFTMFTPKTLAPIALILGVFLIFFSKKRKHHNIGEILTGFGILFIGMATMENSVMALRSLPQFEQAFASFKNPVFGVLVGSIVTVLVQSSSASVGILQASAAAGLVSFSSAIPIIFGQNIGTCITALLSSIGANKNAKRAAMIHLYFNLMGTVVFLSGIYIYQNVVGFPFWDNTINRGGIADVHTLFNVSNTILLIPFAKTLVFLAQHTIKGVANEKIPNHLDERFLSTPPVAVSQAAKEVLQMAIMVMGNFKLTTQSIWKPNLLEIPKIEDNERVIDTMESQITQFLIKVSDKPLNKIENQLVATMFHTVTDVERIGDHCINICDSVSYMKKEDIRFSDLAKKELYQMVGAVEEILETSVTSYQNRDPRMAQKVQPCEDVIDLLKDRLRIRHIDRLAGQKCDPKAGVVFLDIVNNLERIADHCSNIGIAVEQLAAPDLELDPHLYLSHVHKNMTPEYLNLYNHYEEKYKIS